MAYYNKYPKAQPAVKVQSDDIAQIIDRLSSVSVVEAYHKNIVGDLKAFYVAKGYITERQYILLKNIDERYSEEKLEVIGNWRDIYDDEKRNKINVVCEYYAQTGYFSKIVSEWKKDKENYIPTPEQYEKITENTYAKRLIESRTSEIVFANGELAQTRATVSHSSIHYLNGRYVGRSDIAGKPLFIVSNCVYKPEEIYRFCQVFVLSNPDNQFLIREKDLKKYKAK